MTVVEFVRRYHRGRVIGPISLTVGAGQCLGLIGPNGAGKTTLMRAIVGLEKCDAGTISVFDRAVVAGLLPDHTSGMIEEPYFYWWLSGAENLSIMRPRVGPPAAIDALLERVGLDPDDRRPVSRYSQGMRQRLAIARVLQTGARLLVLDEPTNGLDPVGVRWFRELIADLLATGHTVVLSSHLLGEIQRCCTAYVLITDGVVACQGDVVEIEDCRSLEDVYFSAVAGT